MKILFTSGLFLVPAIFAQYGSEYYDSYDDSSSPNQLDTSTTDDSTTEPPKKELTFEQVVEIIRYPIDVQQLVKK